MHDDRTPAPPPRERFDTLFTDPRHFRGDCRLMRTAIRRGWLDDAPQADRDALVARFERAIGEREAAGFSSRIQHARAAFAQAWTVIELERASLPGFVAALDRLTGTPQATPKPGRPRHRGRASEFPRIDANAIRRQAKAAGVDLRMLHSIDVCPQPASDAPTGSASAPERIALAVAQDARYGVRVWLTCPACRRRRTHLYATTAGTRCRDCVGLAY